MSCSDIILIITSSVTAIASAVIAVATWKYTIYSKKNIKILEEQKGLLIDQVNNDLRKYRLDLINLLKKEKKDIDIIIQILSLYNTTKLFKDLKIEGRVDSKINNVEFFREKEEMAKKNLLYIMSELKRIDYLLEQNTEIDIIEAQFGDLFGYNEKQSSIYYSIINESLDNFKTIFNQNEKNLVTKIFMKIWEEKGFKNLLNRANNMK